MMTFAMTLYNEINNNYNNNSPQQREAMTVQEESELVQFLYSKKKPFIFDRHFYIFDFAIHPGLRIDLVNMVREPVSRIVSMFYYLRSKERWRGRLTKPPLSWREKSIDTCVQQGDLECQVFRGKVY